MFGIGLVVYENVECGEVLFGLGMNIDVRFGKYCYIGDFGW